ncbi:MAG: hypothetical protein IJH78_01600 [Clostridia bacterium]|nr:hypothetical protein [Clostridia bacterium]
MRQAVKREGTLGRACRLGDGSPLEERLLREGTLVRREDGAWEVFSLEAKNGTGELVRSGDFVKLDTDGRPYPNERAYFEAHHEDAGGGFYRQIPVPVGAWRIGDAMCEEIRFLLETGRLRIDPGDPGRALSAELFGTVLSAAADAAVVVYSVARDEEGGIRDISFNFVAAEEFARTYVWLGEEGDAPSMQQNG